jgi:hypothetical protein
MAIKFNWKDMKTHVDTTLAIPLFSFGEEDETFIQEDYVSSKKFLFSSKKIPFHPGMQYSRLVDEER